MKTSKVVNLAKNRIVELVRQYRRGEELYQIGADEIACEDNYHPLYMGICCDNLIWKLVPYTMPMAEEAEEEEKSVKKKSGRKPTKKGGKVSVL